MDRFEEPIKIARKRVAAAGLADKISCVVSHIAAYDPPGHFDFDVGFSSHACGSATDDALKMILSKKADFVLCSCCVGKIKFDAEELPRSKALQKIMSKEDFLVCVQAAEHNQNEEENAVKMQAKLLLECDRLALAQETGLYEGIRSKLDPITCSPKHDVIIGRIKSPEPE
jgi:hypothetical protein